MSIILTGNIYECAFDKVKREFDTVLSFKKRQHLVTSHSQFKPFKSNQNRFNLKQMQKGKSWVNLKIMKRSLQKNLTFDQNNSSQQVDLVIFVSIKKNAPQWDLLWL